MACLLLLQSALQPLWVLAFSTIVEYSQQEGFYRVPLPAARQTPNLEDLWLERSNSRHQVSPRLKRREGTPAAEGGTRGAKFPRILPKVATSTSLWGSFTCRKFTTWDRRLYFPSEGRRAEDFFGRVWTRELGYKRPARSPLEHQSRSIPNCFRFLSVGFDEDASLQNKKFDTLDELFARILDSVARIKKREDQIRRTSCELIWGFRRDFRGFVVTCNKLVISVQQISNLNKIKIKLTVRKFLFPYYHSQRFCIGGFEQLYLGKHTELDTCSYDLFFSHKDQ
jgi:hypothetical protein